MPKMNIITNLKEKLKNIPLIHFGKPEPLKPETIPEPLTPPRPVDPIKEDK